MKTAKLRFQKCMEVFAAKRRKYGVNRTLDTLYHGSNSARISLPKFWLSLFTKHYVWLTQMCHTPDSWNKEDWDEVFTDLHNYLYLLEEYLHEQCKM